MQLLYDSARDGNVQGVKSAIDKGGYVEFADKEGLTPLLKATSLGLLAVMRELEKSGANMTAVNKKGENALHIAAAGGEKKVVEYLLKKGNPCEKCVSKNNSPWQCILLLQETLLKKTSDSKKQDVLTVAFAGIKEFEASQTLAFE